MILDASGSMNARLPNGDTRIEVAPDCREIADAAANLDFHVYGLPDGFDMRKVLRLSLYRTIQVHKMNNASAGLLPPTGH